MSSVPELLIESAVITGIGTVVAVNVAPDQFKTWQVSPGTFKILGYCWTPQMNTRESVEGYLACMDMVGK